MRIFLDTGDLGDVDQYFHMMPWLAGVTTTPKILERGGGTLGSLLAKDAVPEVHTEVLGVGVGPMRESVEKQIEIAGDRKDRLVFKVPFSRPALKLLWEYRNRKKSVRFNMHCVNSRAQLIATMGLGDAKPDYICLMAGKTEDQGYDVAPLIKFAGEVAWPCEIMLSSFRGVGHYRLADPDVLSCITVPPKVLNGIFDNDRTTRNRFEIGA